MNKRILVALTFILALVLQLAVDPSNVVNYPFTLPSSLVAFISVTTWLIIGHIFINVLLDAYLDEEYKNSKDPLTNIARSIHVFSLTLMFIAVLFLFYT